MENVLLIDDPVFLTHDTGPGHPESAERLVRIHASLPAPTPPWLVSRRARPASDEEIGRVHPLAWVHALEAQARAGDLWADSDTVAQPPSVEAWRHAAGGACLAVERVLAGEFRRALVLCRPPGHHAESQVAGGFCFLNNVAIAARHARWLGMDRVLVVDHDVHHGNGTQAIVWTDPQIALASIHQAPLYPFTGSPDEVGVGNVFNEVVPAFAPREVWRAHFTHLLGRARAFEPDLVLISAGFDALGTDPLANQELEPEDFGWAVRQILEQLPTADGKVVSCLEGGYDLGHLGEAVRSHLMALAGLPPGS